MMDLTETYRTMNQDETLYFSGDRLYGDDFNAAQIEEWFADEREGYANLGAKDRPSDEYWYHARHTYHVFRHLPNQTLLHVLGFGSAYAEELRPIASRIRAIKVVDPSPSFARESVHGVPVTYVQPVPSGKLPFDDNSFDLITCFGVLHHIPNVSFVLGELSRVLKAGGHLAVCEPVVSMGDWTKPRRGLTKRERGIPIQILARTLEANGLKTIRRSLCGFPLVGVVCGKLGVASNNSAIATRIDAIACRALAWNLRYHAVSNLQKLRPTQAYFVAQKRA